MSNDNFTIRDASRSAMTPGVPLQLPQPHEIDVLKRALLFTVQDRQALRGAWEILAHQTDDYLDRLPGLIAAHPALCQALSPACATLWNDVDEARRYFRQWLFDICQQPDNPRWLQPLAAKPPSLRPGLRYALACVYPLLAMARPLLAAGAQQPAEVEQMQQALTKALLLQVILASKIYAREGEW